MQPLAQNLRRRAQELGISNSEAARRSGLDERRYGHYVTGAREPDLVTLVTIAKALQTTPDDLLGVQTKVSDEGQRLRDQIGAAMQHLSKEELRLLLLQVRAWAEA